MRSYTVQHNRSRRPATKNGDIEWKTLKFSVVVSLNACTYRVQWNGHEIVASLGAVFYLSHAVGCYSDIFPCIGA